MLVCTACGAFTLVEGAPGWAYRVQAKIDLQLRPRGVECRAA